MAGLQDHGKTNTNYGNLRLKDYFVLIYCIVRVIVWELPIFILTYPYVYAHTSSTAFTANLQYFLARTTNNLLNTTSLRSIIRSGSDSVLSSQRYNRYHENIGYLIERPAFAGYWVLRHSLKSPKAPSNSDLVIFYLHGGGYITSRPAHYLLFLLRLAETILEQGISVSIFAPDYSLAPEHVYPTQLQEAAAAYAYLIDEEQIPVEKIVVAGDSAGGHLALSLLVHLNEKRLSSAEDKAAGKPGGLVLMSPWLSFNHEPPSYTTNAHKDVLSGPFLRRVARCFLGHIVAAHGVPDGFDMNSPYLEFLTPKPEIVWQDVLPSWVWVSAGRNEIFLDNVKSWVDIVDQKLADGKVVLEVGPGRTHVWQWLETVMNEPMKKVFLARDMGDRRDFEATASVGRAITARAKGVQAVTGLQ